jgi:hypothetical protein
MRLYVVSACLVAGATACELVFPVYEVADSATEADVVTADVVMTDTSTEGGSDGGTSQNLVLNPSFENGTLGCGDFWTTDTGNVTITHWDAGHTGSWSCRVCADGGALRQTIPNAVFPPETQFVLSGWISPAPPSTYVDVVLHADVHGTDDAGNVKQAYPTAEGASDGGWVHALGAPVTMGDWPSSFITIYTSADLPDGGGVCFLIDDVSIVAAPQ